MNRQVALDLLHEKMQNQNLRRHCYAVEVVMKALANHFKENEEEWGIAGLIHDVDYEQVKDTAKIDHTIVALKWLEELGASEDIKGAVAAHAWNFVENAPKPQTPMQWSLYCCDELTGFIVAVALVKPDKKLASVNIDSVLSKWKQKSFAGGVHREQIEICEKELGIPLPEFIDISLRAMQSISSELGL